VAVNGVKVHFFDELRAQLISNKGKKVALHILRGNDTVRTNCTVSEQATLGFVPGFYEEIKVEEQRFNIFQAFSQGIHDGIELIVMQARQFVVLFTVKDAHQQVGGFYTMVQQMNSEWDWQQFWMFTGFLSLALAFMNFLPIPMLDGGYIMFILWEMVTGKKVSDQVIYYANNVGLFIVLGLMIYANTDWLRN
jgi:regulator of sigma E protease